MPFLGFVAPKIVALMTDSDVHSVKLWREVFFVFAAVAYLGGFSFLILASGELQPWAENDLSLDDDECLQNDIYPFVTDSDSEES